MMGRMFDWLRRNGGVWLGASALMCGACSENPQQRATEMAQKALYATVSNPDSVRILGVSKADSVFGQTYLTQKEKIALSALFMDYCKKAMEETDYFSLEEKPEYSGKMQRQLDAVTSFRSLIDYSSIEDLEKEPNKRNPFNGWKVKIEFTGRHEDGEAYKAEGWFILDKEAQVVLKHFEIPVL